MDDNKIENCEIDTGVIKEKFGNIETEQRTFSNYEIELIQLEETTPEVVEAKDNYMQCTWDYENAKTPKEKNTAKRRKVFATNKMGAIMRSVFRKSILLSLQKNRIGQGGVKIDGVEVPVDMDLVKSFSIEIYHKLLSNTQKLQGLGDLEIKN